MRSRTMATPTSISLRPMCAQCMAGAMTAGVAATGARAWLATRLPPRARVWLTRALLAGGLIAAGLIGPSVA